MSRSAADAPARGPLGVAAGLLALLLLWEALGRSGLAGAQFVPASEVVTTLGGTEVGGLLLRALSETGRSAAVGFVLGALAATLGALLARLLPGTARGLEVLALVLYAMPVIAVAPLLVTVVSRAALPVGTAAVTVYFPTFVATSQGLGAASAVQRDLCSAFGATRLRRVRHLDVPLGLPAFAAGLQLAIPGALLGALVGEWFGSDRGLGVVIVTALRNGQAELLWAAVTVASTVALVAYVLLTILQRKVGDRCAL